MEIFPIEAGDSPEVKQVKEKLNLVYVKSGENATQLTKEVKEAFATEVKAAVDSNTELKGKIEEMFTKRPLWKPSWVNTKLRYWS